MDSSAPLANLPLASSSSESEIEAVAAAVPAARYVEERMLGRGAMGVVHLVRDRETGERLALKKLFRMDGKSALRVKREFRALADLRHPNLVRVYELGRARDGWFLAMEYVEGEDLSDYIARDDRDRTSSRIDGAIAQLMEQRSSLRERVLPAFHQLAEGVHALHCAAMLHRDLKPSNVMVANGRVVVLDFGLVRELDPNAPTLTEEGGVTGTPAYMAPEQALGKALTEASDWYAFGAMLYEALTGELPFEGPLHELLRAKLELDPPPASELNPEVPAELSRLCAALLSRDPSARPSGREVLAALEPARPAAPSVSLDATGETSLHSEARERGPSPAFFGRHAELDALRRALHQTEDGTPVVAHVRGMSGAGKSLLVEHFLDELDVYGSPLRRTEALVLRSRCYEREAMPFKALDGVIDALARHLAHLDDLEVSNLLPTQIGALTQLFPVLERLRAVQQLLSARSRSQGQDAIYNRQRAEAALRELFARISERQPVVIWIDDLQWGDLDSARILNGWLKGATRLPLLLLFSYRSDEVETSECLQLLLSDPDAGTAATSHVISVAALAADDVSAMCRRQLGDLAGGREELVARIVREAQGSPFLANQLTALAQAKLLRGDHDLGALTIGSAVAETSALLSVEARQLLAVLAVAGRPLRPKLALRAANLRHGGRELVHALRGLQLVRTREVAGDRLLEVYHDRVREAVQRGLGETALAQIHASLLSTLEYSGHADPDWLHTLALGAGERIAAFRYGLSAAERATASLAFERAAELYARCLELGAEGREERRELLSKLADALGLCGRGAMAADAYLKAAELADDPRDEARFMRLATSHSFRSGRFEQGEETLKRVIGTMGMSLPSTRSGMLAAIAWERTRLALRGLGYSTRREEEIPSALLSQIDTLQALREESASIDPLRAALLAARQSRLALDAGEPMRVLQILCGNAHLAATSSSAGAARRTDELLAQAKALADKIGTPSAHGLYAGVGAVSHFMLGRLDAVLEPSADAVRLMRSSAHDHFDANYYMRMTYATTRIAALFALGEYRVFADELRVVLAEAYATDNLAAQLHLAANETVLDEITGNGERAIARLEKQREQLPRGDFGVYHAVHMWGVLHAASCFEHYEWGLRYLAEDWPRYQRSLVRTSTTMALFSRQLRAQLILNHQFSKPAAERSMADVESELKAFAKEKLRRADSKRRRDGLVRIQRARVEYAAGDVGTAVAAIRALLADPNNMLRHVDRIRLSYVLGRMLGGDEGEALLNRSRRALVERGVPDPERYMRGFHNELFEGT